VKERSREAHVADHRLAASSGGDLRGPPDDQRHAEGLLVHQALVEPALVSEEEALVRGVDHHGVLGQAFNIEPVEQSADPVVDGLDGLQVITHVALVLPRCPLPCVLGSQQLRRNGLLDVGIGQVVGDRHPNRLHNACTTAVVVPHGQRLGDRAGGVEVPVSLMRHPWAVRSLVVHHEAEGPVPVPDLEPLEAQVGDDVGGIALDNTLAVRTVHDGAHVGLLTRKDAPVIEPPRSGLRRDAQVPLPEDRGLVPRGLQPWEYGGTR
jgi:hypothetical protein